MSAAAKNVIRQTQNNLITLGISVGKAGADGIWGRDSIAAFNVLRGQLNDPSRPLGVRKLIWGQKFTQDEITKVAQVIRNLGMPTSTINDLMACMAWESGETFSPSVKNPNSTATGLIQFMEATAKGLGTTTSALAKMSVIEQLDYVEKYFKPYAKRIKNLGDLYMAIIWPAGVGKPDDFVLWKKGDKPFEPNKGLDINQDGLIIRMECLHKVTNKYVRGALPVFARDV